MAAKDLHCGTPAPPRPAGIRCAIYTRKSTEEGLEQEFNTLDAQREAAQSYIASQRQQGWVTVAKPYADGGYSGSHMDRPALRELLADIARGEVECVVVYKVDRLTRSLLDFSRIMEVLDRYGATFVAVTQQFHTSSSLGRLTLHMLLSFAQFERELIAERTRDKIAAARQKGKWMGGRPVLGYDRQASGLAVNQQEAVQVRAIFGLYLALGSPLRMVAELERRGWRLKSFTTVEGRPCGGARFTPATLGYLLRNPLYTGQVRYRGQLYPGEHAPIVEEPVWSEVQRRLGREQRSGKQPVRDAGGAPLQGMVWCASCDVPMIHTYARNPRGPLYRYYVCGKAHRQGWRQCLTRSVSAPTLEQAVLGHLAAMAQEAPNPVRAALERCGTSWEEMNDRAREQFLRTVIEQVRYHGPACHITLRFTEPVHVHDASC